MSTPPLPRPPEDRVGRGEEPGQARTQTTSSSQNFVTTFTMRLSHRPAYFVGGWWGLLDTVGHRLHVPKRLLRPVCDRFDIAVGIPKAGLIRMDYDGKAPWWLRG